VTQVPGKSDEAQATPEYAVDVDDEVTNKFETVDSTALESNLTLTPLNDAQEALVEKTIDLDLPSVSQGEFDTDESATIEGVPLLETPKAQPDQPPESGCPTCVWCDRVVASTWGVPPFACLTARVAIRSSTIWATVTAFCRRWPRSSWASNSLR